MSGLKLVDQAEHDRRRAICLKPCEFYDAAADRCRACGCVDNWKAWIESQDCPKDFWKVKS